MPDDLDDLDGTVDLCPGFGASGVLESAARGCRPAPCCAAARAEADRRWPGRNKASDGICASSGHSQQNPTSDHEPGPDGMAEAIDFTHDPAHGIDTHRLFDRLRLECQADRVRKVKYLISNRRIASNINNWAWRGYFGSNPHVSHGHISFVHSLIHDTSDLFAFLDGADEEMTAEERSALAGAERALRSLAAAVG